MNIKVLGPGCPNCFNLERNVNAAIAEMGIDATVEKVKDLKEIMRYGVMRTPGLVVDGVVKASGRVPNKAEIMDILKTAQ
jgi:small redox-active disulfide protein 2